MTIESPSPPVDRDTMPYDPKRQVNHLLFVLKEAIEQFGVLGTTELLMAELERADVHVVLDDERES